MIDYSQNGEQAVILDYFAGRIGRFLDVGAWSGRSLSNTYALAERGWSGVCVEPSPAPCAGLIDLYRANPAVTVVNAAVATEAGWRTFYDAGGDAISTMDVPHRDKWAAGGTKYRETLLWAVTPRELLDRCPGPYDVLSLDVEGCNVAILEAMPLWDLGLSLACVEYDHQLDRVAGILAEAGLGRILASNGENVICAR